MEFVKSNNANISDEELDQLNADIKRSLPLDIKEISYGLFNSKPGMIFLLEDKSGKTYVAIEQIKVLEDMMRMYAKIKAQLEFGSTNEGDSRNRLKS